MDFECYKVQKSAQDEIDRLLSSHDTSRSAVSDADSRFGEYSDLFGTLVHRRLATDSVIYHSPALLALRVRDIVYDGATHNPANDVKEPLMKLLSTTEVDGSGRGSSGSRSSVIKRTEMVDGIDQNVDDSNMSKSSDEHSTLVSNDNLALASSILSTKLSRPYFSMVTKKQFFETLYPKLHPIKWQEGCIISRIFSALRGVTSDVYTLTNGIIRDSGFPVVIMEGYTPSAIRKYLLQFRFGYVIRKLLDVARYAFLNQSTNPFQKAVGSALEELLHLVDASLASLQQMHQLALSDGPKGTALISLASLLTLTRPHVEVIKNIFSIIAPHKLSIVFKEYAKNSANLAYKSASDECDGVLAAYLNTSSWCDDDDINDWNLLNNIFRSLQLQRTVLWQMSRPEQLCMYPSSSSSSDLSRSADTEMSADDLSSSFIQLSIGTFLLTRAAAPALAQLESVLFKLESSSYEPSNEEVGSTMLLSSQMLWKVYICDGDSIISYLLITLAWARNRLSLLSLTRGLHTSRHGTISHAEIDTRVIDACRDVQTILFLPFTSADSASLAASLLLARERHSRIKAMVLATIDEWIQRRHGSFVEEALIASGEQIERERKRVEVLTKARDVAKQIVLKDFSERSEDIARIKDEMYANLRKGKKPYDDSDFAAEAALAPKKFDGGDDSDKAVEIKSIINSTREVDPELMVEARRILREKYGSEMSTVEQRTRIANWQNRQINNSSVSKQLLGDLFNMEQEIWKQERLILQSMKSGLPAILPPVRGPIQPIAILPQADDNDNRNSYNDNNGAAGDRPSVRVSQQPGGDSTMNLRDDNDGAAGDRPSVRVSQQPGGDSTMNLSDFVSSHQPSLALIADTALYKAEDAGVAPTPESVVVALTVPDGANSEEWGEKPPIDISSESQGFASCLRRMKSSEPSRLLEAEDASLTVMCSMKRSLWLLCAGNGLIDATAASARGAMGGSLSSDEVNFAALQSAQSLSPHLKSSLVELVRIQCQSLDLAALHSCLEARGATAGLLSLLDSVDDVLLLSPRSDFISSFVHSAVRLQLEAHPLRDVSADNTPIMPFWNKRRASSAFASTIRLVYGDDCDIESYPSIHVDDDREYIHSFREEIANSENRFSGWEVVFGFSGHECIEVGYNVQWPMSVVFTKQFFSNIKSSVVRILELSHLTSLLRFVWEELRGFRLKEEHHESSRNSKILARELFCTWRYVQQTVQTLFDFTCDRARVCQLVFKRILRSAAEEGGMGGVVEAFREYSKLLSTSIFCHAPESSAFDSRSVFTAFDDDKSFPNIIFHMCSIFHVCREALKEIAKATLLNQRAPETGAVDGHISNIKHLRLQLQLLLDQLHTITKENLMSSSDKVNLEVLLKFINFHRE